MSVETELYSTLSGNAALTALVSTRIYASMVPENATNPCLEYSVISSVPLHSLSGVDNSRRSLIQISCYGNTYASAKSVAEAVYNALEGDGYLQNMLDIGYDPDTQTHTVAVDWSFIRP